MGRCYVQEIYFITSKFKNFEMNLEALEIEQFLKCKIPELVNVEIDQFRK